MVRRSPADRYANLDHIRSDIELVQGDMLEPDDAAGRRQPVASHELYNLAATSFVPASWKPRS